MLAARGVDGLLFVGAGATPGPEGWKSGRRLAACRMRAHARIGRRTAGREHPAARPGVGLRVSAAARAPPHRHPRAAPGRERRSADAVAGRRHDHRTSESIVSTTVDAVRAAIRRLIENAVTAIVALSDVAAAAALRECRALGVDVPGRISVMGCGDTALARCLDPQLTSVRVPASASGRAAAEYLVAVLARRTFTLAGSAAEAGHPRIDGPGARLTPPRVPRETAGDWLHVKHPSGPFCGGAV